MKTFYGYTEDELGFLVQYCVNREIEIGLRNCSKEVCKQIRKEAHEELLKRREEKEDKPV